MFGSAYLSVGRRRIRGMGADQWYGFIGLVVTLGALALIPVAIWADARAQRAHEVWQQRWSEWLESGMKGPAPR